MDRQTEERFQRLEAELAHASNNAFDVNSVHIAVMIVIGAMARQLPEAARRKTLTAALDQADRQRNEGLALIAGSGVTGKPVADFLSLQAATKRNIERMLGDGQT